MRGSVYQRINPKTQQKMKTWNYTIDVPRELTGGKRKQVTKGGFKTKKAAEAAMTAKITELNNGVFVAPNRLKLQDVLEQYLEKHVRVNNEAATYYSNRNIFKRVNQRLGHIPMTNLKPMHFQDYYISMLEEDGLAKSTIRQHHNVIKAALTKMKKWKVISTNVMEDVDAPIPVQKDPRFMTHDEVALLLDTVIKSQSPHLYDVILFAIATGMRRGEILGLKWSDINFEEKTLTVQRAIKPAYGGGYAEGLTKTKKTRVLKLDDEIIDRIFKPRHALQRREKFHFGPAYNDRGYVFADHFGNHYIPNSVTAFLSNMAKKCGLEGVTFHASRHTLASFMLANNVHMNKVREYLGHTTLAMTNRYSHVMPHDTEVAQMAAADIKKIVGKVVS